MDLIVDGMYFTKLIENGKFGVDIVRVECRMRRRIGTGRQGFDYFYRYILLPDYNEKLRELGKKELSEEDIFPIVPEMFKNKDIHGKWLESQNLPPVLKMLPPPNRVGIKDILKQFGMPTYDAWTFGKKAGHTIWYSFLLRSEYNEKYFPKNGIYKPTIYNIESRGVNGIIDDTVNRSFYV